MSLFSCIDTRAPSTEEIIKIESEYDKNGKLREPSWLDSFELSTELSMQKLSSLFNSLSIALGILGVIISVFASVRAANGAFSYYSAIILLVGLAITFVVFALMRLARTFTNFMLVRLLQTEESDDDDDE